MSAPKQYQYLDVEVFLGRIILTTLNLAYFFVPAILEIVLINKYIPLNLDTVYNIVIINTIVLNCIAFYGGWSIVKEIHQAQSMKIQYPGEIVMSMIPFEYRYFFSASHVFYATPMWMVTNCVLAGMKYNPLEYPWYIKIMFFSPIVMYFYGILVRVVFNKSLKTVVDLTGHTVSMVPTSPTVPSVSNETKSDVPSVPTVPNTSNNYMAVTTWDSNRKQYVEQVRPIVVCNQQVSS